MPEAFRSQGVWRGCKSRTDTKMFTDPANSLSRMAIVLASLKHCSEALQSYQQAQQISESLNLDLRVEQCQKAIAQLQKRSH
jgi:hypothetical protein